MALNERDCFDEFNEMKPMSLRCPKCGHRDDYSIKWLLRERKERMPGGGDPRDRAMFEKLKDHLFRVDDTVSCSKCRRQFEIPSHQTMVFLDD